MQSIRKGVELAEARLKEAEKLGLLNDKEALEDFMLPKIKKIIVGSSHEWDELQRKERERLVQELRDNPDMKMPVLVNRKDCKIHWKNMKS